MSGAKRTASGVAVTPAGSLTQSDAQAALVGLAGRSDALEDSDAAQDTAIAGKLAKASNLSDVADAAAARANLGLGSAAQQNTGAFDTAGAASAAVAAHVGVTDPHGDRAYADGLIAANDALVYKGVIDASANPNYPAASAGHFYKISVAGKIGGASGSSVEVGDSILCTVDGTSAGTQAAVGSAWSIIQTNIDGAVIGPASSVSGDFATFSGTGGKLIQDSGISFDTDGTLAANSDTRAASQKAVKTYVDAHAGGGGLSVAQSVAFSIVLGG